MGYITTATTTTLRAKLTPLGRKKLIMTNNNLVTSFSLGDSDANYYAALPLTTGEVPSNSGDIGPYSSVSNSVAPNVGIKSLLLVNSTGALKKAVEPESNQVTTEYVAVGSTVISGSYITQNIINRNDQNTDSLVNLYYSLNLSLNSSDDYKFTGITSTYGGFSDTALSGVAKTKILVIALDNTKYGDLIDGKTIKLQLTTTASTFTIYSTFQNTGLANAVQDANYVDTAVNTANFGSNVAFLVSDDIMKPNGGDSTLSWATGYGTVKPFSVNSKQYYNFVTNSNLSQTADTVVGIAYLDKGLLVITHPTIVNNFDVTSNATVVTCDSVSTMVSQNITCLSNRGEFGVSTNPTFSPTDTPRISEIALYDTDGDLIAIAKMDRHLVKNVNEFFALGIRISL
jgi:hypothetical protein